VTLITPLPPENANAICRAGKFVIGEFGAYQLTDPSRLIMEA
jgi:hypothetical protein